MLALRASDGAVLSGWDLPRAPADALLFRKSSSSSSGSGSGSSSSSSASSSSCPPLLVLTTDREFVVLEAGGGAGSDAAAPPANSSPLQKKAKRESLLLTPSSAFEAKFGGVDPSARPPATPERVGGGGHAGTANAADSAPWAALFDAPSHALPAPGALASRFLDSLLVPAQR